MDPSPEDMFTTTLDCLLRSKGKKALVVKNGPTTLTFNIFSYCSGVLHTASRQLQVGQWVCWNIKKAMTAQKLGDLQFQG